MVIHDFDFDYNTLAHVLSSIQIFTTEVPYKEATVMP